MRRIGLVVHGQPPELVGGTERLVAALGAALAGCGDRVEIFSGSIEWRPQFEVVRDESGAVPVVRVHRHDLFFERWDKLHNPLVERAYLQWIDAFEPTLLHVHHWARLTTSLVARARARGIPVVASLHDLFTSCPRYHRVREDRSFCTERPGPEACRNCAPRWRFQRDTEIDRSLEVFVHDMRAELSAASVLVAPTRGHAERVLAYAGLSLPFTVVPPAAGPRLRPASRPLGDAVATQSRPLRVGVFGHLHSLKGVEVLLDAQAVLADPFRVEIHVWGKAPLEDLDRDLRARAARHPVVWHGAYHPEDLSGAPIDLVVLPTLCSESYSFALDEACALQVPVLATDLGALSDRATDRIGLFPRGDVQRLSGELDRLAGDPSRRNAMVRAKAPDMIDTERHLELLEEVYARALARGTSARALPSDRELSQREHAFLMREAGLEELLRSEGWEDIVEQLRADVARLRRQLGGSSAGNP